MKNENWYIDPLIGDLEKDTKYYQGHRNRKSLITVAAIINEYKDCSSVLDVGCKSSGFLSRINSKYIKVATDICRPGIFGFDEEKIKFIHGNFLELALEKFDVVCCFEVLEHIRPDVRRIFAQKLLATTSKHLFVSIPYMWEGANRTEKHPHDGYNEANLNEWFWPHYFDEHWLEGNYLVAHYFKDL